MTRRIRFSSFLARGVFAGAALLAGASATRGDDVPFVTQNAVTTQALFVFSVTGADIDGDGDNDLISASAGDDKLAWYENLSGAGAAWTTHTVALGLDGAFSAGSADFDGDGDQDIVVASYADGRVVWYENATGDGAFFTPHPILTSPGFPVSVTSADLDGDGDPDVAVTLATANTTLWLENVGHGSLWVPQTVNTQLAEAFSTAVADLDGDGQLDLSVASYLDDRVSWFQNVQAGTSWVFHTVSTLADGARCVRSADIDGDGKQDLVSASFFDDKVAWYRNVQGDGTLWSPVTISLNADAARSLATGDLDRDGDVDVVSGSTFDDKVAWYENQDGSGTAWVTRTVTTGADGVFSVAVLDLDGDGDLDLASASGGDNTVRWYQNQQIHRTAVYTETFPITTAAPGARSAFGADVDGDGDIDAVSASSGDNRISWHRNAAGDGSVWSAITITTATLGVADVAPGDVDGDGDLDVLSASSGDNRVSWHRNLVGDGSLWDQLTIATTTLGAAAVAAADVDGDGDLDVLSASSGDDTIAWHRNLAGDGGSWSTITITSNALGASSVVAADVDRDGHQDACWAAPGAQAFGCSLNLLGDGTSWGPVTATLAPGAALVASGDVDKDGDPDLFGAASGFLLWLENGGNGTAWTPHPILTATVAPTGLVAGDLDDDGDVDALLTSSGDDKVRLVENLGNGSAWRVSEVVTQTSDPSSAFPADVDRDGRIDFLLTGAGDDSVGWQPNCGGQFSLDAIDVAPPTAPDGTLAPMLRIGASHLGRAGDHPEELARLGLLFEEAPGDPLTSPEANAVIESLRLYRDANADGVFEPAGDSLVASLTNLTLVGGVQDFPLADGDSNVQLDFGAPRTYFLVPELTANAGLQSPNRFRITHLGVGPSASRVEDRSFDIPLLPSCPTDQASGIVRAVNALSADVSATKTVAGRFHPGDPISYAVTLTNAGPGSQPDSPTDELQDTAPPELTVTGADDGGDPGTVSVVGNDVRWNGALAPGASVTVSVQASINAVAPGTQVVNQGTVTFDSDGNGSGDTSVLSDDPSLPGQEDPTSFVVTVPVEGDLVHGTVMDLDLASQGTPDVDLFGIRQAPRSSYEVIVDSTTGDLGSGGSGPALELVAADGTTLLQSSAPAGAGASRSLRLENATSSPLQDRLVRVSSQGCTTSCTPEDRYRIRAYDTTLRLARVNNSSSQVTVLLLQNLTADLVNGHVWLRDGAGAAAGSVPFTIQPRGSFVLNTASVAPGMAGSLTVSHDAPYGGVAGKAAALEPGTGFAFDTPLEPYPR